MKSVRIVTLNCWSEGREPSEKRWPLLAAELQALDPDVVCLQEVFRRPKAQMLQKALGFRLLVDGSKHSGLVLISHLKKSGSGFMKYQMRSPTENYDRHALWVRLKVGKSDWDFFVTHLSWKLPESEIRQHQIAEIWDWMDQKNGGERPCVLTGDMNATPYSDEMKFLAGHQWLYLSREGRARMMKAHQPFLDSFAEFHRSRGKSKSSREPASWNTWSYKNSYTLRAGLPERRIDYLWFRSAQMSPKLSVKSSKICFNQSRSQIFPSDHFGVVTEIVIKK